MARTGHLAVLGDALAGLIDWNHRFRDCTKEKSHPPPWRGGWWEEQLLKVDDAEYAIGIILRAGGVEELVRVAVAGRSTAELDAPELVDHDVFVGGVFHGSHERAGGGVEAINRASIGVIADQQGAAKGPEIRRSEGNAPGLVEGLPVNEGLHECAVFVKDVDVASGFAIGGGEGNIDLPPDVLNAEGSKAGGQSSIGERHHELKGTVVDVDFVVPEIGGVEEVSGRVAGDGQSGINGSGTGVIDANQCVRGIEVGPAADGAVERGEEEDR